MINLRLLSRTSVVAVLAVAALLLFTQHPGSSHAEGTAEDVPDTDLAKMHLALSAYGSQYSSFVLDPESGFEPEGDRDPREVNAYFLLFNNPDLDATSGPFLAASAAGLFGSPDDAAGFIADVKADIEGSGGTVITFPVPELEGASGFALSFSAPEFGLFLQYTGVIFPLDRLVGQIVLARYDDTNIQAETIADAIALKQRMKDVVTGKVSDYPEAPGPDVNCNGGIDSIDATLILQLGAGLVASLRCGAFADANQDGRTNSIDASLILQYSAGLIDRLPVTA